MLVQQEHQLELQPADPVQPVRHQTRRRRRGRVAAGRIREAQKKPAAPKGNSKADNTAIQKALAYMGIDVGDPDAVDGPKQTAGVKAFQRAHGLVEDGHWGEKTQTQYDLNKRVQNAIKKMAGAPDSWKTDGFIGATSKKWIAYTNKHQAWGSGSAITNTLINHLKAVKAW